MSHMVKKDRLVKDAEAGALLSRGRTTLFCKVRSGELPPKVKIGGKARSSGFIHSALMPYLDHDFSPELVPYHQRVCLKEAARIFSVAEATISQWVEWRILPRPDKRGGVRGWAYGDLMQVLYGGHVPAAQPEKPIFMELVERVRASARNTGRQNGESARSQADASEASAGGYKMVPLYDALFAICAAEQSLEKERSQKMAGKAV